METIVVASVETLKHQKMKCWIDEVFKLVQGFFEENISWERFYKALQFWLITTL